MSATWDWNQTLVASSSLTLPCRTAPCYIAACLRGVWTGCGGPPTSHSSPAGCLRVIASVRLVIAEASATDEHARRDRGDSRSVRAMRKRQRAVEALGRRPTRKSRRRGPRARLLAGG